MRYYFRFVLAASLIFLLCSCAAMQGKHYVASKDALASAGRRGSYKVKVEEPGATGEAKEGRRRSRRQIEGLKKEKSDLRKGQSDQGKLLANGKAENKDTGEGQKKDKEKGEQKDVSLFTPYHPQDKPQESQAASPSDKIPADIKQKKFSSEKVGEEEYVTLNFEDAPVEDIINTISESIGLNYIMGTGVKGQISMQTTKPVPVSELFPILQSVLEVNGLTMIQSGHYYKVIYAKEAPQYPIEVMSGKGGDNLPEEDTYLTQIISLDYIPVKDMVTILQPFLSKAAPRPIEHDDLNLLIINDTAANMKRLLKFVQELDKPIYQPKEKVFVYYVENGDAKKLATVLTSIYKKDSSQKNQWKSPNPQAPGAAKGAIQPPPQPVNPFFNPYAPPAEGGDVQGDVTIVSADDINALIITTSPRNYPAVLETVKKLDIQPKQALIEVLVAEISIDDIRDFGLDWSLNGSASGGVAYHAGNKVGTLLPGKVGDPGSFPDGISYMLNKQNQFLSILNTKASEDKLNVLSSPHILASDNQEASIEITQDYPIPRQTTNGTNSQIETTYDYKTAGIKLNFTPKINEMGLVSMKLKQEVSQLAPGSTDDKYIFKTRKAETSVVVHDGETLVIGGLVQEQKSKSRTGVPFLGDIPLLGYLFSHTTDSLNKTELIILITPHVIKNEDEGKELTRQFQDRVKGLKSRINERKKANEDLPTSISAGQVGTTAN